MDLPKKIAGNMDQVTVQKVWNTFLPEQQEKFQERIYQYEQDVNRGGTEPEIAAANRGLMIVNGSPVPKEVAARRNAMRNCVSELLTLGNSWGSRAEHGEEKLTQEKVFTELVTPPYGNCEEKTGQVYWSNWCSTNMEYSFIWFEKQDNMWHAHSDVSMGGIRIKKDTPLPDATDKNITRCLELDSMIYLYHPDIENWIRRDSCGEITLYHQIEEKGSTDEHRIIYTIDPRNGALYYYEGFPWNRAAPEEARPATYAELAQTDSRYTGMTIQNWEKYLPK